MTNSNVTNSSNATALTLKDRGRGSITLNLRDGIVIGAIGSEPERFVGLTEAQARRLARYGTSTATLNAELAAELVGCTVHHRGEDLRIESVHHMGRSGGWMMKLSNGAMLRPSEIRS